MNSSITQDRTPATADLLDQLQVAPMLGLRNPRTLAAWRLRRCGPPWLKIGKRLVRYRRSDVEAWVAAGCPVGGVSP